MSKACTWVELRNIFRTLRRDSVAILPESGVEEVVGLFELCHLWVPFRQPRPP